MNGCPSEETLVAVWVDELDELEAAEVEEHAFSCDACASRVERLAGLVAALREHVPFVISHAHRARLEAAGTRIHVTSLVPTLDASRRKTARFTPEVDLLVFALQADMSTADRVDIEILSPTGEPRYVIENVPFDRASGEVLIACQRHYENMFVAGDPIFSVQAFEAGERHAIGEYVVTHVWR